MVDQLKLQIGDDITEFMERSVGTADSLCLFAQNHSPQKQTVGGVG